MTDAKRKIRDIFNDNHSTVGLKLAAIKFLHRVVLVQSKGVTDPRVNISILLRDVLTCSVAAPAKQRRQHGARADRSSNFEFGKPGE
jgi:hypothetical protein